MKRKVTATAPTADPTPAPATLFSIPAFFKKLRASPWVLLVGIAAIAAGFLHIWPDGLGGETSMAGWVITWFGAIFKAISAAVVCRWFARHVLRLDLSTIEDPLARSVAGLGYAILMAAFILGVTHGL
jgi:hypothetical protein